MKLVIGLLFVSSLSFANCHKLSEVSHIQDEFSVGESKYLPESLSAGRSIQDLLNTEKPGAKICFKKIEEKAEHEYRVSGAYIIFENRVYTEVEIDKLKFSFNALRVPTSRSF